MSIFAIGKSETAPIRFKIKEAIKQHDTQPNPSVLAGFVIDELTQEELNMAAAELLIPHIRDMIRAQRRVTKQVPNNSDKWDTAKFAVDILKRREFVHGSWKFLADCTPDEVFEIAAQHREEAERNLKKMKEYEGLANAAKEAGVKTLGALESAQIASVYKNLS